MRVEKWVNIKGYENLYQISDFGRVKTLARARVKEHIIKPENNKGYLRVCLSKKNKRKHFFIHRLVAEHFIPNTNNLPYINHKDQNPLNNDKYNLEWCTHIYNLMYGDRRKKVIEKERKPINQYSLDGKFIRQHYSMQDAARCLKKSASAICRCCKGKQQYAYNYKWQYANRGGDD